jgi:hypothetical protein
MSEMPPANSEFPNSLTVIDSVADRIAAETPNIFPIEKEASKLPTSGKRSTSLSNLPNNVQVLKKRQMAKLSTDVSWIFVESIAMSRVQEK